MRRGLQCPGCREWIATDTTDADGRVTCRGCGARFRLERRAKPIVAPPETESAAPWESSDADESTVDADESETSNGEDDFAGLDLDEFNDDTRRSPATPESAETGEDTGDAELERELPRLRRRNRKTPPQKVAPASTAESSKRKGPRQRLSWETLLLAGVGAAAVGAVMVIGFAVWNWSTSERAPASSWTPSRYTVVTKTTPSPPALRVSGFRASVENKAVEWQPLPLPPADLVQRARERLESEHRANAAATSSNASLQDQYPPRRQRPAGQRQGSSPTSPVVPDPWKPFPKLEVAAPPVFTWGAPTSSGFYSLIWLTSEKQIATVTARNPRPQSQFVNHQRRSRGTSVPSRRDCAVFYETINSGSGGQDKSFPLYDYSQLTAQVDQPLADLRRAALSWDSQHLATTDLASFGAEIDVFDAEGKFRWGFIPYENDLSVDWIGWDREARLLTLGGGRLTSWDLPNAATGAEHFEERYEIDGSYRPPIVWSPGRKWLAASAGSYVDFLDPQTGACLGRVGAPHPGHVMDVAVQDDGTQAAVLYQSKEAAAILISDLQTGQSHWLQLSLGDRSPALSAISSVDRERLAVWGRGGAILETATGKLVENFHGFRVGEIGFRRVVPDQFVSQLYAPPGTPERQLLDGPAIRLEVDTPDDSQNERIANALAQRVQDLGYRIGDNGFALRVTGLIGDGDTIGLKSIGKSVSVPGVKYRWELFNPHGHVAWKTETMERYTGNVQRFMSRTDGRGRDAVIQEFRVDTTRLHEAAMKEILSRTPAFPTIPSWVFFDERGKKRP